MKSKIGFDCFLFFDGAMGTQLHTHGIKAGELPESYNFTHPHIIEKIHRDYIAVGADVITTNTFGASRYKLAGSGFKAEDVVSKAVGIARRAAGEKWVALDIGPTGKLLKPHGDLSFEDAYQAFAEQVRAGAAAGVDLVLIETMSDVYEAKAAVLAAKENCELPVICTMTFQRDGRTLTGTDPLTMVNIIQSLGVDALGLNCSLGPKEILPLVKDVLQYSKVPVIVQPNAGLPKIVGGNTVYEISPREFAAYAKDMAEKGVTILGGCCGTTPEHIIAVKSALKGLKPIKRNVFNLTAASSYSKTVILSDGITIIGERLNPTGKPQMKNALKNRNYGYIIKEAIKQRDAGAHIIDVNVGLPEIDEKNAMVEAIMEIQSTIDLPLQIDSTKKHVLEAACRIYNGRPVINSVSGKERAMRDIFPIAKKYGACVVALTLDESGLAEKAEDILKIAEKIVDTAKEYGIEKHDIIIDCLALTASAQQSQARETLKALALIKQELGMITTLGISNISFGLPNRPLLNRTFLASALSAGLDAPILDPLDPEMMKIVDAADVLLGFDINAEKYVSLYPGTSEKTVTETETPKQNLKSIVIEGLKQEAASQVKKLLKQLEPIEIVNTYLVPALDIVGQKYEAGEVFLPQLMQSAETVKIAFDVIKGHIASSGKEKALSKGRILLATVRGDIHDIGKNLVKVMLENYGYEVVDMGIDVPEEDIVQKAIEENIYLVGLSALMTTSLKSMEKTISALRQTKRDIRVMVGGAVLSQEYADMVGADYYGENAQEAVKIAQKVFESDTSC